jgi:uncharacterized protein (TIGR02001 family)
LGVASLVAGLLLAGPALADGLPGKGRPKAPEVSDGRPCTVSANVGYTTDYVFRGISQSNEDAAVQGGVDFACGRFYIGTWGSSIAFGNGTEIDVYGGYRTKTGPVNWDLGFIYYAYPGAASYLDLDYFEFKVAASGEVWKGGTLGGTVFYSPEYTGNNGEVWTWEVSFSQALPKVGIFAPTVSVLYGRSDFQDDGSLSYGYWNAGLTLAFHDRWSLDLRYWDSENSGFAYGPLGDERFVASLKYTF